MSYCVKVNDDKFLIPLHNLYKLFIRDHDSFIENQQDLYINSDTKTYLSTKAVLIEVETYLERAYLDFVFTEISCLDYVYILHDKDINLATGELCKPHHHIYIHLADSYSLSVFASIFHTTQVHKIDRKNKLLCKNKVIYLTHEKSTNKYVYSRDCLVFNSWRYWSELENSVIDDNVALSIVNDILCNLSYYNLLKKYGREFLINRTKYLEMAELCKDEYSANKENYESIK